MPAKGAPPRTPSCRGNRMTEPSLEFIGRQNERILQELANIRDAIDVLTAMAHRHEGSIQSVVQELQSIHRINARAQERLRKLEEPSTTP
jgi:ABC-type enterochelin transport system substrate-binding protein